MQNFATESGGDIEINKQDLIPRESIFDHFTLSNFTEVRGIVNQCNVNISGSFDKTIGSILHKTEVGTSESIFIAEYM